MLTDAGPDGMENTEKNMFLNFEWVFVQVNLMLRPGFLIHGSFRFIYQQKQDLRQKQNNWQCIKRIEARKGILLKNITYLHIPNRKGNCLPYNRVPFLASSS